jgi:hypothetical protein
MTVKSITTTVLAGTRHHPGRALAVGAALVAASVYTGSAVASAGPEASLAVTPAELHAAPAPLVMNFDGSLTGARMKTYTRPRVVPVSWNVDGCDHDYGTANVCVPWQIPAAGPQAACGWLKGNGFHLPLKVYGTNRQHLPENAQGYVCPVTRQAAG